MYGNSGLKSAGTRGGAGQYVLAAILCLGIVVVVCAILFPVIAGSHHDGGCRSSPCVANINQVGKALKSYMTDWNETYPTNRLKSSGRLASDIPLSPKGNDPKTGKQRKCYFGVNWVEALYPYIEKVGRPGDNETTWKCPSARSEASRVNPTAASTTYAINMNLLERSEAVIRVSWGTMLLREMDRPFGAVCRPINRSSTAKSRPIGAFLTESDPGLPRGEKCKFKLHGPGSFILFVDGHSKLCSALQMPTDDRLVWDRATKQWWSSPDQRRTQIAINP